MKGDEKQMGIRVIDSSPPVESENYISFSSWNNLLVKIRKKNLFGLGGKKLAQDRQCSIFRDISLKMYLFGWPDPAVPDPEWDGGRAACRDSGVHPARTRRGMAARIPRMLCIIQLLVPDCPKGCFWWWHNASPGTKSTFSPSRGFPACLSQAPSRDRIPLSCSQDDRSPSERQVSADLALIKRLWTAV